jgi:acetyl-CoA carboxylase biotin carboxyl carrier protein
MTGPAGAPEPIAPEPIAPEPLAPAEQSMAIEPHDGTVGTVGDAEVAIAAADPALLARLGDGDASLLALIDRLAVLLARSDLAELEVEAGKTGLILRKPSAFVPLVSSVGGPAPSAAAAAPAAESTGPAERPSVKAPLTGIFYTSPAPGSAPFVTAGSEVAVGTVIGLIEAMKLFNEIKSDLAGRVVRVVAETGSLVKAKQPLIEVEPL